MVKITLKNTTTGYEENNYTEVYNDEHINYLDIDKNEVQIDIFEDGIILYKKAQEYSLTLNLLKESYALISSNEGNVKIDAKVVAFVKNNDTIVMHYIIEDENRVIEINY